MRKKCLHNELVHTSGLVEGSDVPSEYAFSQVGQIRLFQLPPCERLNI